MENLIKPTTNVITAYARFWNPEECNKWETKLFENQKNTFDIRKLGIDFNGICQGERVIDEAFGKLNEANPDNTFIAVLLLDSIYHTRLKDPIRVARSIHNDIIRKGGLAKMQSVGKKDLRKLRENVDIIAVIDKGKGGAFIYSFATKFCNRLAPDKYPIFDSFTAGLLMKYLNGIKKTSLGNYETYVKEYNRFIKEYKLDNNDFSYKDIDVFLWTYGKALHNWLRENDNTNITASPYYLGKDISYVPQDRTDS